MNTWFHILLLIFIVIKLYKIITKKYITTISNITGKTIIITGGNRGLGFETARILLGRNARVILACRNIGLGNQAKAKLISETGNENVEVYHLDLSSLRSVRQFVKEIQEKEDKIDVLINNAGIYNVDDLKLQWQVNHFGPFLLTNLLLGMLKKSAPSRIIFVSSIAHLLYNLKLDDLDEPNNAWKTYCNTKLANILTSNYLAKKLQGTGVTVNSLHPGIVYTDIFNSHGPFLRPILRVLVFIFGQTAEEGALTSAYLTVDHRLEDTTGKYFSDCNESCWLAPAAKDEKLAEALWKKSELVVDLKKDEKVF